MHVVVISIDLFAVHNAWSWNLRHGNLQQRGDCSLFANHWFDRMHCFDDDARSTESARLGRSASLRRLDAVDLAGAVCCDAGDVQGDYGTTSW
jgi:hypothetical protein